MACYTQEQLDKTKQFQLDLLRKLFTVLMESQEEDNLKFDIGKCSAFNSSLRLEAFNVITFVIVALLNYSLLH